MREKEKKRKYTTKHYNPREMTIYIGLKGRDADVRVRARGPPEGVNSSSETTISIEWLYHSLSLSRPHRASD